MQNEIERENIGRINADICSILEISSKVGWAGVSPISIYRILYLSSILFTFRYPEKENPFSLDYNFSISLRGPYYENIDSSINYLLVNQIIFLDEDNDVFKLGNIKMDSFKDIPYYNEKKEWITAIIYILGIYGEDKIYDFIFRDPEYQENLQKNSKTSINLDKTNVTIEVLNKFKNSFEERLGEGVLNLDSIKYLKLYFEYVFSIILKGEADL